MNFNLLWKPVTSLIVGYASHIPINVFWTIFKDKLDEVTEYIRAEKSFEQTNEDLSTETFIDEQLSKYWTVTDRTDLINYRILLWRLLADQGSQLIDVKNRDIVTLVMDFLEHEYRRSYENEAQTWNVSSKTPQDGTQHDYDDDNDDAEAADDDADLITGKNKKHSLKHKATQRSLIAMLNIFVKCRNPKQMYRQTELYDLYLELLCHRNPYIQKVSLDCIMVYKFKYLIPYKEYLYDIIDEQKFKMAIQSFKIDAESGIVQPEHRADIMPILMRILYSKLVARGKKGTGQSQKTLVMRFLAGCHPEEIQILFRMSFSVYDKYLQENDADVVSLCKAICLKTNFEAVLSPKKLQSSLNLIEIMREQFGGLMGNAFLQHLLKVLLCIGSIVSGVLDQQTVEIDATHLKLFKTIRNGCIQSLSNFFIHFDSYSWSTNETEAIFNIFIDPQLTKLASDSIHSATPLLKLLSVFGKNSRYFVLLTKQKSLDIEEDKSPLRYIMDLLLAPKTKPLVCLSIMEMIQNLLSLSDEQLNENGEIVPRIEPSNCLSRSTVTIKNQQINYGSQMLLPYLPKILEKFQLNLRKRRGLTKRDLHILSLCTELITDQATCRTLLNVLLPILVTKSQSSVADYVLEQMVTTIKNLFDHIDKPTDYIRDIAPMFEQITAIGPRKLLCELIGKIVNKSSAEPNSNEKLLVNLVTELNSWDRRWVEQPNYERRLMAYKTIGELQSQGRLDLNIGLIVIYHSFYFIKHDKDMAMRDTAAYHLKQMVPALAQQFSTNNQPDLNYLIGNVVLNLCRRSLADKNENIRTESIQLLGELARECPTAHPVLHDLNLLTSKQDREVDFFDNITHLQSHRHSKALLRFISVAKTLERIPVSRTLTQFILPLAAQYLCTEKYASKHGLVTSAIETVGAVCRLLPWHHYESILKFYLKKMRYNVEFQKQLVRLVVQILDAFHFDLSRARISEETLAVLSEKSDVIDAVNVDKSVSEKLEAEQNEEEIVLTDKAATDDTNELVNQLDETIGDECDDDEEYAEESEPSLVPIKRIKICIYDAAIVLGQKAAARLIQTITSSLMPMLHNSITTISAYENFHKLNKKKRRSEREEEEILRVPIALAMVKLLQKLPDGVLGK